MTAVLLAPGPACVVYDGIRVRTVDPAADRPPTEIESPVKAHLLDGTTVVYPDGVVVGPDALRGRGTRHDVGLRTTGEAGIVPLDSVAAMEAFPGNFDPARTVVYSLAGTALGIFGGAALMVALFGSCPTVYADSAGTAVLQAEAFSTSIAPLFESRDVDRLAARPDADGRLVLEVRNEALETHYVNHLELLEVRHARDERVVPDERDRPLAVGGMLPAARVLDRAGRDLSRVLARADGRVFASDEGSISRATARDLEDWIDVVVPVPAGVDSLALVLRARNSLLGTVLLYDVMLGPRGAGAVDWVGRDLARLGEAGRLGRWHHARMGMRVEVAGAEPVAVARIGDAGPIAWKDVAVVVPAPAGDSLRIRLRFAADAWRIDRLEVATRVRRPEVRSIPLTGLHAPDGGEPPEARNAVAAPDEAYVATTPGQRYALVFETGPAPDAGGRTFLLAAQGYYIEWIRGDWIRRATERGPFVPGDDALVRALARWGEVKDSFEERFYASRVPVR